MYSGENEYEECKEMIFAQTYKNFDHFVYENLSYKEAHDRLYGDFMEKAEIYDILIKIDADMVLREKTFFQYIVERFRNDNELDIITMALHDFYLDEMIWGMHAYRNTIKWDTGNEIVYTDRMHLKDNVRKHDWVEEIFAEHCKNPAPFQAFHFGFHRGLKAVQPDRIKARLDGNYIKIHKLQKNYAKRKDIKLAYALAGAEYMLSGYFSETNISYNENLENKFRNNFQIKEISELDKFIKTRRILRFAYIKYPYNYYLIFIKFRLIAFLRRILNLKQK